MKIGPNPDSLHPDDKRTAYQVVMMISARLALNGEINREGMERDLEVLADRLATMCAKISTLESANRILNNRLMDLEEE